MARKAEPGISYYQMDCDHINNKMIKLLINDHDSDGYWIWQCLTSYGYRTKGYYFDLNDEDELLLFASDDCKKPVSLVKSVITSCLNRGLFNKDMHQAFNILTCDRMQQVYQYATSERRRKGVIVDMIQEYLLIDIAHDARNMNIISRQTEVLANTIESGTEAQPSEGKKRGERVKATDEEQQLTDLKATYDKLEKTKEKIFRFIEQHQPKFIDPYVEMWNIWAGERQKAKISTITDKRRGHFNARMKEPEFKFLDILAKATKSSMCLEGSWFTFDFITKSNDNYIKVLEGNYDNSQKTQTAPTQENEALSQLKELINK